MVVYFMQKDGLIEDGSCAFHCSLQAKEMEKWSTNVYIKYSICCQSAMKTVQVETMRWNTHKL